MIHVIPETIIPAHSSSGVREITEIGFFVHAIGVVQTDCAGYPIHQESTPCAFGLVKRRYVCSWLNRRFSFLRRMRILVTKLRDLNAINLPAGEHETHPKVNRWNPPNSKPQAS